jgi:hypothetical protein
VRLHRFDRLVRWRSRSQSRSAARDSSTPAASRRR